MEIFPNEPSVVFDQFLFILYFYHFQRPSEKHFKIRPHFLLSTPSVCNTPVKAT
ncbi:hypothetical protein NEIELOOT_00234 [Neisseria elongata subsp. glycolytica ATCC 29315]|uniref:Uncharacterized protein n=1 Tax=Neisseria elongata subsp. glycolytica ATCC 29315 TaxID=546263 RepID=D4DMG5_NEIEG|nr:hypothetical protein NEIELOOT_00234 [Neisseria elongata subsp. glycolytica ATCC 29315]